MSMLNPGIDAGILFVHHRRRNQQTFGIHSFVKVEPW
jgi:hypothetical protein